MTLNHRKCDVAGIIQGVRMSEEQNRSSVEKQQAKSNNDKDANIFSKAGDALFAAGNTVTKGAGTAASAAGEAAGKAASAAQDIAGKAGKALEGSPFNPANLDEEQIQSLLSSIYDATLNGIPHVSSPVDDIVDDYQSKYSNIEEAAKALIRYQIAKCATSGFLTSLGGAITIPVAIPANISSVMYVQMRMVAALAKLGGYDLRSDQVQTLVYICLTGTSAGALVKKTGVVVGNKVAINAIKQIPGKTLNVINQKVGFRLITKFGQTGAINLGKMVPLVGGVIGGSFDAVTTKAIASSAYNLFIKGEVPAEKNDEETVIDIDDVENE